MIVQIQNQIKTSFDQLEFEEGRHIYRLNGKILPSVSSCLKKHYEEFDENKMAISSAKKQGVSVAEIKKRWKNKRENAATNGTKVHLFAENYWLGIQEIASCNQEIAFTNYYNSIDHSRYKLVWLELRMFSNKYKYAGTSDLLLYDTLNNGLVIGDYKTNEDLDKQWEYLYPPFEYTPSTPYNKYQLQLSYYQIMLEEFIDIPVIERQIIWLKRDGTFELRQATDFTKQIKTFLDAA